MEISVKRGHAHEQKTACLVVGVHAGKRLGSAAELVDKAMRGALTRLVKRGDISGHLSETLMIPEAPGTGAERVLLVGCGKPDGIKAAEYLQLVQKVARTIADAGLKNAVSCLSDTHVRDRDLGWKIRQTCSAFGGGAYRFDQMKSKPSKRAQFARLGLLVGAEEFAEAQQAANTARCLLSGMGLMKDLANLPGNHCPPSHLAETARDLGKAHKSLKVTVLERAEMEKLGMGSLLAVARGSVQAPKLVTLEYSGCPDKSRPIVLIGKGVTFDSGGISIKPGAAMDEMKYDMTGAASVLGVMKALAELSLPINVVGVIPAVENMPDGNAIKPGDVVTSMSGQTIEILNTDAEGRLILCDAMTYAARFEPEVVIDIATLTGACVIALGSHASGLLSNHDDLADELLAAGEKAGDRAWRLPLWDEYQKQLDSPFADMANVGGREAGTITAACFLSRFAKDYRWAHLDIAGTAWTSGKAKGATGRPLPLLMEFIIGRANLGS
jgi:leucyl aminopeptidase